MKAVRKLVFSSLFAVVIFTSFVFIALTEIFPSYSEFIYSCFCSFPKTINFLIYFSIYIVLFLLCFLIFSMKRDYSRKIRKIILLRKNELLNEYKKELFDNEKSCQTILKELSKRKKEFSWELKENYSKNSIKYIKVIDKCINSSWKEIENYIKANKTEVSDFDDNVEMLYSIDETKGESKDFSEVDDIDVLEELESVEEPEISEVEELEELEVVEDEDFEELEEAEETEEPELVETVDDTEEPEELEELKEAELPETSKKTKDAYFSLTGFCNEKKVISEIFSDNEGTIIESDGIYTISDNLSYQNLTIDQNLKNLVDSILK